MCGLVGFVGKSNQSVLKEMADSIKHRGPNSWGTISLRNNSVHLAHRRLSILDLTEAGHQPMSSVDGNFVIVFNGEIYNHLELRSKIKHSWKGHSDTETLIEYICHFGIEQTLKDIRGMFAFVLYDLKNDRLVLARDISGEKPLYYGLKSGTFFFTSELKALYHHPHFDKAINHFAIPYYLKYGFIPHPHSIFEGILKLPAGHYLEYNLQTKKEEIRRYWKIKSKPSLSTASLEENAKTLDQLLTNSVQSQLLSDVPVGTFLSGGVDSTTIAAVMAKISKTPVKTFSIGFHDDEFNEAHRAKKIAGHLQTDHHELYVNSQDLLKKMKSISSTYDEPFADSSQIPTLMLCEFAKKEVTVCLSGDAADELFGGYNRYKLAPKVRKIANLARNLGPTLPLKTMKFINQITPKKLRLDQIQKMKKILQNETDSALYSNLLSINPCIEELLTKKTEISDHSFPLPDGVDLKEAMMMVDYEFYLQDDILTKVDRSSMSVSLEIRSPFLNQEIVEFAFALPMSQKIGNESKIILRQNLAKYVPMELLTPGKMGFSLPLKNWIRNELREWFHAELKDASLSKFGIEEKKVMSYYDEHLSGNADWSHLIWSLVVLSQWSKSNL